MTDIKIDTNGFINACGTYEYNFLQSNGYGDLLKDGYVLLPGFCDVHVHLREPGFTYKETILSGTRAGARGGYTAVCSMPNLKPVPDSMQNLKVQTDAIKKDAIIAVYPYGSITVNEEGQTLSPMEDMAQSVCAFSDDGKGVQSDDMMKAAMTCATHLDKIIAAHCEDNTKLFGGYIHDGSYAATHNHKGISSESEYFQISRDLDLAAKTGCKYHVCHISTKESVSLIRSAKKSGVNVTCETAPHYLILTDADLKEDGRFKMNPPLRSQKDKEALIEGICDGTIDMIATDHAPHSKEEKSKGLKDSLMGVVGLETAFAAMYTHLVKPKIITLEKLTDLMSKNPRKRFDISSDMGFCVFDIKNPYIIDPNDFKSMGRSTPFAGSKVYGRCVLTVYNGKVVHLDL